MNAVDARSTSYEASSLVSMLDYLFSCAGQEKGHDAGYGAKAHQLTSTGTGGWSVMVANRFTSLRFIKFFSGYPALPDPVLLHLFFAPSGAWRSHPQPRCRALGPTRPTRCVC